MVLSMGRYRKMKVLLFERDADVLWIFQQMLEICDLEVTAVGNCDDALTELSRTKFRIVFLDHVEKTFEREPSLSCMVRAMQPGTSVVITSPYRLDAAIVRSFDAVLVKPFSLAQIQAVIRTVTARV
jgi:DNA-binding NtrC family response regulator